MYTKHVGKHICARPSNMRTWPKTHMHARNRHTNKTGGVSIHMNGRDGRSGSIIYGRALEEGVGVPTRARVTIFAKEENSKKTACTERSTQTSQEKYNQGGET